MKRIPGLGGTAPERRGSAGMCGGGGTAGGGGGSKQRWSSPAGRWVCLGTGLAVRGEAGGAARTLHRPGVFDCKRGRSEVLTHSPRRQGSPRESSPPGGGRCKAQQGHQASTPGPCRAPLHSPSCSLRNRQPFCRDPFLLHPPPLLT